MNERIKELMIESGSTGTYQVWFTRNEVHNLAELLVRECAAKAWWAEQYDMGDGKPISKQITLHFGVEE